MTGDQNPNTENEGYTSHRIIMVWKRLIKTCSKLLHTHRCNFQTDCILASSRG